MRALSISAAWEETKAILVRDGRLYVSVALALIALPAAINTLVSPNGVNAGGAPEWTVVLALVASLIALAGQLALIRLALGPSVTVGSAIAHGLRRMPFYFLAVLILVIALFLMAIPFGVVLVLAGVPVAAARGVQLPSSPATLLVGALYFAVVVFFAVRMVLSAPVASAEKSGPIAILRRSWALTASNWWPLFGFLTMYVVGAIIVLMAVNSAVGVVVRLTFGAMEPLSAAALVFGLIESLVSAAISGLFALMIARIYVQLAGTSESASEIFS